MGRVWSVWTFRAAFHQPYEEMVAERIAKDEMKREPVWSESLAVGSQRFIREIQPMIRKRMDTEVKNLGAKGWTLEETEPTGEYGAFFDSRKWPIEPKKLKMEL